MTLRNGSAFRAWREAWGYTQEQLAEALGVHRVTVAEWEASSRSIDRRTQLALAALAVRDTPDLRVRLPDDVRALVDANPPARVRA